MTSPFTIQRGRAIRKFPLRPSGAAFAVPAHLSAALETYRQLVDTSEGIELKARSIAQDPDLTPVGRRNHLRGWAQGEGLAPLKAGVAALSAIESELNDRRAKMKPPEVDRTDVVGALLRQEIRGWLRSMPIAQRTGLLNAPDISPSIAQAITEAPRELSDVSPEQHARLSERAALIANPDIAREIDELEEASEAVASAIRAAKMGLKESAGLLEHEVNDLLGAPTLGERILQRLQGEGEVEDHAA